MAGSPIFSVNFTNRKNSAVLNYHKSWSWSKSLRGSSLLELKYTSTLSCRRYDETSSAPEGNWRVETFPSGFPRRPYERSRCYDVKRRLSRHALDRTSKDSKPTKTWYRWFSRPFHVTSSPPCWWTVNKRSLISSFCLSTSICSFHHCYLCLPRLHENHL